MCIIDYLKSDEVKKEIEMRYKMNQSQAWHSIPHNLPTLWDSICKGTSDTLGLNSDMKNR